MSAVPQTVQSSKSCKLQRIIDSKHKPAPKLKLRFAKKKKKRRKNAKRKRQHMHQYSSSVPLDLSTVVPLKKEKILWRPKLQIIFKDALLLNALSQFMSKSYNAENILFLLAVRDLRRSTNSQNETDSHNIINSIYDTYIVRGAQSQINLSYQCFVNILSKRDSFTEFDMDTKQAMFDQTQSEIETLMITSILPLFYRSPMFQSIAKQSEFYERFCKAKHEMQSKSLTYDIDGFLEPMFVRNQRPSPNVELYNSITEISEDVNFNEYMDCSVQ